ncbi:MAG: deoxyribonuclease IV [Planctomycetes bacterium]|jgi:deoxyribonuclease-4|nr:deoxyribonuclease IV [Planctomycetota bacterium]
MLAGAHMSIAGGVHRAVERAEGYGMTALQIFTRTARAWTAPPIPEEEERRFRTGLAASGVRAAVAHATYLANPASPDGNLRRRSERALVEELLRCEALTIPWLILHPGSGTGSGAAASVRRAGRVLARVLAATSGCTAGLLVENTAGQGDCLGAAFAEVGALLAAAGDVERLGACLDTCHAFAAGYDLPSAAGFVAARAELDREVGLARVRAVHVNDCVGPLGCRVDRHAGLGLGTMGLGAFRRIARDRVLGRLPLILETPKGELDGEDLDARNLRLLRKSGKNDPGSVLPGGKNDPGSSYPDFGGGA